MEKNVQKAVEKFKKGLISRREILNELNSMILKTPSYHRSFDEDVKHEFYAFIVSKIEKILMNYTEVQEAKFSTWFNLILNRHFIVFIKRYKNEQLQTVEYVENINRNTEVNEFPGKNLDNLDFTFLTKKERDILSLKYGYFINDNYSSEFKNIVADKVQGKLLLEAKITQRYLKIINLQNQLINEVDDDKIIKLRKTLINTFASKRHYEKKIESYKTSPTNKWIAEKIGIAESTVAVFLKKIRMKIKNRYAFD